MRHGLLVLSIAFLLTACGNAVATNTAPVEKLYRGHTAAYWHHWTKQWQNRAKGWKHEAVTAEIKLLNTRKHFHAVFKIKWKPTVEYALRLASTIYGVPYDEMSGTSWCESHHTPTESDGEHGPWGLFQFMEGTWNGTPFASAGFSVFDPVANALAAAWLVKKDGSWREWQCKADGSLRW